MCFCLYLSSPNLKIPDDVQKENERIKYQNDAKKSQYMDSVHPMKKAARDDLLFPKEIHASSAPSSKIRGLFSTCAIAA